MIVDKCGCTELMQKINVLKLKQYRFVLINVAKSKREVCNGFLRQYSPVMATYHF